ncbi:MAG: ArsA family ATPase [Ilumatobacteraceae bacterium]
MSALSLDALLGDARVVVCCGSGGVGKTTTAAALGLEAARRGRRAVVITIDPAKRLADALGVPGGLGNEPIRLTVDTHAGDTDAASGELWAMMLDTASTFDGLVRGQAASPDQAERILANGFYRNIASSLSGTQEYMAAERLHALHHDDRFDVVIVDTPPSRNALDFLDAPSTLSRFLEHPVFKLMMLPARRGLKVLNIASQPLLRSIGKVVGGDVLADAIAFFQAFAGMETGFRQRADDVQALLRSPSTRFVLIASPRDDTIDEARYFAARLSASALPVTAVIVNRCTPLFGAPSTERPADSLTGALHDNLAELHGTARREREQAAELLADVATHATAGTVFVPTLPGDVHDLGGLEAVRLALCADSPDRSAQ